MRRFLLLATFAVASGCMYTPTYSDLTCNEDGATRDGRRCEDGVWVTADTGVPPQDVGADGALPPDDMDVPPQDMGGGDDVPCSAESDEFFCMRLAKNCGDVTAADNCGDSRTVSCGSCDPTIQVCTDNVCELVPETDQELCDVAGATCDDITVLDRTGVERTVNCGTCTPPLACGSGGTPNTCACANADDAAFCADNGADCGPVTAMDPRCNVERTVNCGSCNLPETCGGGGVNNVCGCAESDAAFCARVGRNCGSTTADDACGVRRTVNCGSCTMPETCGGGGQMGVCGCTTQNACESVGAECGTIDTSSVCDNIATANCGGCGGNGSCVTATNICNCDGGYAYNGSTCADVNECFDGTDMCHTNATCTNSPGSYSCACNMGFSGDGFTCTPVVSAPVIEQFVVGTAATSDTLTTTMIQAVDDQLYVAFVTMRTGNRTVDSIDGLGLTWTKRGDHCNGNDTMTVEIWTARGNTSSNGVVTVNLSQAPHAGIVTVFRVSGVPNSGAEGNAEIVNSNGLLGACNSSNAEASYSFSYTPQYSNSLLLTGTAIEERAHTPGTGWTEVEEYHQNGQSDNDAGLALMSRSNGATTAVTVAGTLDGNENWVTGVFEVRGN